MPWTDNHELIADNDCDVACHGFCGSSSAMRLPGDRFQQDLVSSISASGCPFALQNLQPQLMITMGEVSDLMVKIDKEKKEVVEPAAAAVAIDEAAAQEQADAARGEGCTTSLLSLKQALCTFAAGVIEPRELQLKLVSW